MLPLHRRFIQRASQSRTTALRAWYSSTMHDNDPEVLELEKKRNLTKIQHRTSTPHEEAATGWNEHIATTSEAFVKADRVTLSSTQEMQQKTIKYVHSRHSAVSEDESTVSRHEAEKVPGPLGSAPANEGKKKD